MIEQYLLITGGQIPEQYKGPEEEAQKIKKCSIFKDVNLSYSYCLGKQTHYGAEEIRIMT